VTAEGFDVVVRWAIPAADAELAALALWDHGATAVSESSGPEAESGEEATIVLVASYPTAAAAAEVAAVLGAETEVVDPSWRDAWKAYAAPVEISRDLIVVPAWRPVAVAGSRLVLEIDSGPCFGSGSHASTRLILQLLAARPPVGETILDVGTGSGILAVAAARLGAAGVVAVDIDPAAVAVTEANAERNGVTNRVRASNTRVGDLLTTFDGAMINVTAGVHAELGRAVVALVRPGGWLYVAGLLPGQWPHVAGAYAGCLAAAEPELDGWVGVILHRPTTSV
jgi:ribosomal protein L11 methyltransferase